MESHPNKILIEGDLLSKNRYRIVDPDSLVRLMGCKDLQDLQSAHKRRAETSLRPDKPERKSHWTDSIAVGSKLYIEGV